MSVALTDPPAAAAFASGKGHAHENFPVASFLIARAHRPAVMAFYRFARAADDIADNAAGAQPARLAALEAMRATLVGESDAEPTARVLRETLAERAMEPEHPLDLLAAFRRDVANPPCDRWADLLEYCRFSAAPVGRFVLDLHGEARALWPMNDALCAGLQIVNHLQDCGRDWAQMGRCYLPLDELTAAGWSPADLARPTATPAMRATLARLARRTTALFETAAPFASGIKDRRLRAEVAVIHRLGSDLARRLATRDPLSERVHHSKPEALALALPAALGALFA